MQGARLLLVAIPAIGMPTIVLTRLLAWWHQPQLFATTLPSVSKTAALAPGSWVFATGMLLVAGCSILAWPIFRMLNRRAIRSLAPAAAAPSIERLNSAAALAGVTAGCALGALAVITLEVYDALHMLLSQLFFSALVLALLCDALVAQRLPAAPAWMRARLAVCGAVVLFAVVFLFMYVTKDSGLIAERMLVRWLYVGAENLLCLALGAYPLIYLPALSPSPR